MSKIDRHKSPRNQGKSKTINGRRPRCLATVQTPPGQRSVRSKVPAWRAPAAARRAFSWRCRSRSRRRCSARMRATARGCSRISRSALAQLGVHRMGHDGGQKRHEEHGDAAGGHEHGSGLLAHGLGGDGHAGDGHDDRQRRGAVEGDGQPLAHVHGARLAPRGKPHEDGERPHEQQKQDEQSRAAPARAPIARTSTFAPDTTKNSGTRKP